MSPMFVCVEMVAATREPSAVAVYATMSCCPVVTGSIAPDAIAIRLQIRAAVLGGDDDQRRSVASTRRSASALSPRGAA